MLASIDWANLTTVGAFVVGVAAGTIATIRVFRYVLDYVRHERERGPDDPSTS